VAVGDLLKRPVPAKQLERCDAVVNCAARVHVTRDRTSDPEAAYRAMNSDVAIQLLKAAAEAGAKRFVQLSSVAALAARTPPGMLVDDSAEPHPQTPYGRSKLLADERLAEESAKLGVKVVSLRPPAVIGPVAPAHLRLLMRCAKAGIPLPIGGVDNRRTFMFVDNVADAVLAAASGGPAGCFIITDSPPISTATLYRALLRLCGHSQRLPSLPLPFLRLVGRALLGGRVESIVGNAAFDGSRFSRLFDWTPPVDFETALELTVGR